MCFVFFYGFSRGPFHVFLGFRWFTRGFPGFLNGFLWFSMGFFGSGGPRRSGGSRPFFAIARLGGGDGEFGLSHEGFLWVECLWFNFLGCLFF